MANIVGNKKQLAALSLLLLASLAQVTPALHHHDDEHACAKVNGKFVYVTPSDLDAQVPNDAQVPDKGAALRGMRLGSGHEHHLCSLCHLLHLGLLETTPHNPHALFFQPLACHPVPAPSARRQVTYHGRAPPPLNS